MILRAGKDHVNIEDGCAGFPGTAVGWGDTLKGRRVSTGNALMTKSWVLKGKRTLLLLLLVFRDRVSL